MILRQANKLAMLLVQLLLLLPQVEELRTTLMCQPEAFIEVCVCVCVRRVPAGETTIAGIAPAFLPLSGRERESAAAGRFRPTNIVCKSYFGLLRRRPSCYHTYLLYEYYIYCRERERKKYKPKVAESHRGMHTCMSVSV